MTANMGDPLQFELVDTRSASMNLDYFIAGLARNRQVFDGLTNGMSLEQSRWKPSPEKWSILEVVNHLYDEEREDFRQRLDLILNTPDEQWPSIDPQGWVTSRAYNERDLESSRRSFFTERDKSLEWLAQLSDPEWNSSYAHPNGGIIKAGDLLAAWLAHDYLHIRQLARLHWQYVGIIASPYQAVYAGPWKET
jgi:hypothetical protein